MQTISRIFRIREATLVNGKLLIIDDARPDGTRSMYVGVGGGVAGHQSGAGTGGFARLCRSCRR